MNEKLNLVVVIMAGGVGTRFWPLSTEECPKQFLKLFGDRSLLQRSVDRVKGLVPPGRIMILTNAAFIPIVTEQLHDIPRENIIGEPMRRDTAAAVALAAALIKKRYGNPVIITITADHMISPVDLFQAAVRSAAQMAEEGKVLYTFGIKPTYPATGYGYLERGEHIAVHEGFQHFELKRFVEKPDLETAREYCNSGNYYWNSGMFVWTADAIMEQIEAHLPQHAELLGKAVDFDRTTEWDRALKDGFEPLKAISIDFGVMEKAPKVRCVEAAFNWSDIGGWLALRDYLKEDKAGNYIQGNTVILDASNNLIYCENIGETVMMVGVNDLVVVRAGDKTLITHKDRTEDIKKLVKELNRR